MREDSGYYRLAQERDATRFFEADLVLLALIFSASNPATC
jgi:hypothetical protein